MNLTLEEFCLFNIPSRIRFLKKDGYFVDARKIGQDHNLFLFCIYNFYVEMLVDSKTKEVVSIDPVRNKAGLTLYAEKPA